jgi:hypothetical protein
VVWQGGQIELFPEDLQSCSSLIDLLSPLKAEELNANERSAGFSPARYTPPRARETRMLVRGSVTASIKARRALFFCLEMPLDAMNTMLSVENAISKKQIKVNQCSLWHLKFPPSQIRAETRSSK